MTRWLKRFIPCIRSKQLNTSLSENEKLSNVIKINDEKKNNEITKNDLTEIDSEIELFSEVLDNAKIIRSDIGCKAGDIEETSSTSKKLTSNQESSKTIISCTLHESLNDFCQAKVTHTNYKSRASIKNNDKPRKTLIFKTIMVNGEPCTTRYKTTETFLTKENCSKEFDSKLGDEIKGSDIKLVFSHDVLEYLTKSFLHNKDNDLNRQQTDVNDIVVCTLFPKQDHVVCETDMEVDINGEIHDNNVSSETCDNMDVDDLNNCSQNNVPVMQSENYIFNKNQSSTQRSEYKLTSTNSVKGFQTSMSKSSPHMQQENGTSPSNRDSQRLRPNVSKKVSWKENVEVCFFNHSSRSANEILQEVQPLIDHEVYWKECVCEMDRKRREKWLKIRADEQRCLTGDGQFHDYFTCRTQHDDDDIRLIE